MRKLLQFGFRMKELLEYLIHNGPAVAYICKPNGDPDGDYTATFITDNIQSLLGYKPQEFLNDHEFWINNIHPDDKHRITNNLKTLYTNGRHSQEFRFRAANGDYHWMLNQLFVLYDDNGVPNHVLGYWLDITNQKNTEHELRRAYSELEHQTRKQTYDLKEALKNLTNAQLALEDSEHKHRTLFEASHDAVILLDEKGFVDCNPAALNLFACDSYEKFLQLNPVDFSPTRQPGGILSTELVQQYINKAYKDGGLRFEWDAISLEGKHFDCEVQLSAMSLKDKPVLLAICRDISERKRAEQERELLHRQLRRAHRVDAIGRLTGGVAHDFNNLLTSILGFSNMARQLSLQQTVNGSKIHEYLSEVVAAGDRAKKLVKQLLSFTRGETVELQVLDPDEIIIDTVQMLRSTIPASIEMNIDAIGSNHTIRTNAVQLQQLIVNLIINARDSLPNEKGAIRVAVKRSCNIHKRCESCYQEFEGDYVEIHFTDNGHGIQTEDISRIFEPFFTTKEVGKGSGLGLSVVHGIMHSSSGHINIQSSPGNGTTVSLYFPSMDDKPAIHEAEYTSGYNVNQSDVSPKARILLVDDEVSITDMLRELLVSHHYDIVTYNDPTVALAHVKREPAAFDLVITDQTMPRLTGMELAEKIVSINNEMAIVLMTGYSTIVDEVSAERNGITKFLEKPIDMDILLRIVHHLVNQ